jgi:hypothetical protein
MTSRSPVKRRHGGPEHGDDHPEGGQRGQHPSSGGTPITGRAGGEHDGGGFDSFDGARKEHREEQRTRSAGHQYQSPNRTTLMSPASRQ